MINILACSKTDIIEPVIEKYKVLFRCTESLKRDSINVICLDMTDLHYCGIFTS